MSGKRARCGISDDNRECGENVTAKQWEQEIALGNFIWVKIRNNLWWPAQIFDANSVSKSSKPRKRQAGAVLVRLYGSYEYLYVDPVKCHSEFEIVLKQSNGSYREIFEKALEQVCSREKSARSKTKGKKSTVSNGVDVHDDSTDEVLSKSEETSARKLKVMRVLGLTAPSGSPYGKNGKFLEVCDN